MVTIPPIKTSEATRRHRAIAASNGSFYHVETGAPLFGLAHRGRWVSPLCGKKAIFYTAKGVPRIGTRLHDRKAIQELMQGGPLLVSQERVAYHRTKNKEGFVGNTRQLTSDITVGRHPRTAALLTSNNRLLIVVVDGRQPKRSVGLTLSELAQFCVLMGAQDALNLDGGSSSQLVVHGRLVSRPSSSPYTVRAREGYEKSIPLHLGIFEKKRPAKRRA